MNDRLRKAPFSATALLVLLSLAVFPTLAVLRLCPSVDPRWLGGYAIGISLLTYFLYRLDKKQAQTGGWGTPESTLHLAEFLGGWPGALIAQRTIRHKNSKTSYQVAYWAIVAVHQFAAFDFLWNWKYSQQVLSLLRP